MNGAMSALRKLAGQSGLPRTLDLSYPSNRYAVGGALVSMLAARALGGTWREAGSVGIGAFAAWATARELDPDHPETATVALPLAAAAGWLGGPGNPVAGLSALSGLRVLGGTVGPNDAALDSLALTAATALCAWHGAHVYRVHEVVETRHVLDMISVIAGELPPARLARGLA